MKLPTPSTFAQSSSLLCLTLLFCVLPDGLDAQPNRGNPVDEFALELPVFGRMIGTITKIQAAEWGEEYGRHIWAIGSVNDDTLQDWVVSHLRCDTMIRMPHVNRFPREILLYQGVAGRLPTVESGQRIGPSELHTETSLLGSGDWDGDGHIDLLLKYKILGDTSFGMQNRGSVQNLAVFWGNSQGRYSLEDTTRLVDPKGGWGDFGASVSGDFDSDGISDVLLWDHFAMVISNGQRVPSPELQMFKGLRGRRWGRNGVPCTPAWVWWNPPMDWIWWDGEIPTNEMTFTDQDCDGYRDICFFNNDRGGGANVSILYGRSGMPDTTDVEHLALTAANGQFSLLSDVTGDGTVDLVVNCGPSELIRVYAGRPGQRLLDLYRSGNEGSSSDSPYWRRPWGEVFGPRRIHEGWSSTGFQRLFDLGDIHGKRAGNTANEIWTFAKPELICYTGGLYMDSLIDATFHIRPGNEIGSAVRLGDIDGSGVPTIAVQYDQIPHAGYGAFPGGIAFIKVNELVPWVSGVTRHLPHIPGEACAKISSVPVSLAGEKELSVEVLPVPSRGQVRLRWETEGVTGDVQIELSDALGVVVLRTTTPAAVGETAISTEGLARGTYFGSVRAGGRRTVVRVVVP